MKKTKHYPWLAQQTWRNIIFIHFPVQREVIQQYLPDPLHIDLYDEQPWVSIVAFQADHSRLRGMPRFFALSSYVQLNVRTYVKFGTKRGVYFLSIHANEILPVFGARLFSLPFHHSEMKFLAQNGEYRIQSVRKNTQQSYLKDIELAYKPFLQMTSTRKGSLEHWLIERYNLWFIQGRKIHRASISHQPWKVQRAITNISINHHNDLFDHCIQDDLVTHYSPIMDAYLHPFQQEGIYLKK